MKLTMLLLTVGFLNVHATGVSQNVSFSGEKVSLESAKKESGKGQSGSEKKGQTFEEIARKKNELTKLIAQVEEEEKTENIIIQN